MSVKSYFEREPKKYSHNIEDTLRDLSNQIKYQEGVCSQLEDYANFLTSLIKLSKEYDIEVTKLANLIYDEKVHNINAPFADEYLNIFLDSIEENEERYHSVFNDIM